MSPPRLALVPGEPAGVGPELCVRLAQRPRTDCSLVAFADPAALQAAAAALRLPLNLLPENLRLRATWADEAMAGEVLALLLAEARGSEGEAHA